jgi:hypothetical protein
MNQRLALAAPIAVLSAFTLGCNHVNVSHAEPKRYHESVSGTPKEVATEIHMGAGQLTIDGGATNLLDADFYTSSERPTIRSTPSGDRTRIEVTQRKTDFTVGDNENDWDLHLGKAPLTDLELHLGAGEGSVNLRDVNLRRVVIHMGAGKINVDLRGPYSHDIDVELHGGVGEGIVRLPRDMAIDATVKGGIGEIEAPGLEERGDGRYVRALAKPGGPKLRMEAHGGIGRIELNAN